MATQREIEIKIETALEKSMAFLDNLENSIGIESQSYQAFTETLISYGKGVIVDQHDLHKAVNGVFAHHQQVFEKYRDEFTPVTCTPSYLVKYKETNPNPNPNPNPRSEVLNDGYCYLSAPDYEDPKKTYSKKQKRLFNLEDERLENDLMVERLKIAEKVVVFMSKVVEIDGSVRLEKCFNKQDLKCVEEFCGNGFVEQIRLNNRPIEVLRHFKNRLERKRHECESLLKSSLLFR